MGKEIETAFGAATNLVLGKRLANLDDYGEWLARYAEGNPVKVRSAVSGKTVYSADRIFYNAIKKNMVTMEEAHELGKRGISSDSVETLALSNAGELLKDVKYVTPEAVVEPNMGIEECALYGLSHYCYRVTALVRCKYCAYCFWPRESEYCFGSRYVFTSKFCIKCYYSAALTRCFEVSDSTSCSDTYFSHNCEGLQECMFCFNAKSRRYAVCNVEVGREQYMRLKKAVVGEIAARLEKNRDLGLSIYNLGCKGMP